MSSGFEYRHVPELVGPAQEQLIRELNDPGQQAGNSCILPTVILNALSIGSAGTTVRESYDFTAVEGAPATDLQRLHVGPSVGALAASSVICFHNDNPNLYTFPNIANGVAVPEAIRMYTVGAVINTVIEYKLRPMSVQYVTFVVWDGNATGTVWELGACVDRSLTDDVPIIQMVGIANP